MSKFKILKAYHSFKNLNEYKTVIRISSIFILSFVFTNCSNYKEKGDSKIEINQHFSGSEVLLDWFEGGMLDEEISKLTDLPGIQIMEASLIRAYDEDKQILSFNDDLILFKDSLDDYSSIYGIDLAHKEKENTSVVLNNIKTSGLNNSVINRALYFFPKEFKVSSSADIYYVLTGWEWGDAYVRPVENVDGDYKISADGKPSIIFNLSLFAKRYGDDTDKQFQKISNVMSHELFHFVFSDFKEQSDNYKELPNNAFLLHMLDIVQNEGIAHYVDRKDELKADFLKFQDHQKENFRQLSEALFKLSSEDVSEEEKQKLLRNSNVGKYWSKYGAITGMFMAYHIEQSLGKEAITKTIQEGALSFISTYIELQKVNNNLPLLEFDVSIVNTK